MLFRMPRSTPADPAPASFSFNSLLYPFYVPAFLSSVGTGLAIPLLPLYAETFDPSGSLAGIIVGLFGLGSFLANVPAGILSARLGDRRTMILAVFMQILGAVAAFLAPGAVVLGFGVFVLGGAQSLFFVSRLSYFRTLVPGSHRGRALALIGGEYRLGYAIGPAIGGFLAAHVGYPATFAGFGLVSGVVVFMAIRWLPQAGNTQAEVPSLRSLLTGAFNAFRGNGRIFATAGLAIIMLQLVRAGRGVILPLWGIGIGLSVEQIGLTVGVMYAVEMVMFVPAGFIMDRFGRKWSAVPCLVFLAAALALLPLVRTMGAYFAVAALAGVGNGLGSGINMTLSTDYAPRENPGNFIGAWRFIVDGGTTGGPFIVSAVRAIAGIGWSGVIIAGFAAIGAGVMAVGVKEPNRSSRAVRS